MKVFRANIGVSIGLRDFHIERTKKIMKYISVKEAAEKWGISQTLVRRYCGQDRVPNAKCQCGTWLIPDKAKKPEKASPAPRTLELLPLAKKLVQQKKKKNYHGLYDYVQIDFTYSSSRMASNRLTRDQVESIFRKGKVQESFEPMKVSDLVEVMNHCVCIDYILDHVNEPLTQKFIQHLHYLLMFGSVDHRQKRVTPGVYRNELTKRRTRPMPDPKKINSVINHIICSYEANDEVEVTDILDFHAQFEKAVPFEDGNGRIGRLIMFKECLRYGITPFIIDDKKRGQYIEGLQAWPSDQETLLQIVEIAQKRFERQIRRHLSAEGRQPHPDDEDDAEGWDDE